MTGRGVGAYPLCVHAQLPHTSTGIHGEGCHTAQPVYFCSPCEASPCDNIWCAYVGGGRIAKPPSELAALHTWRMGRAVSQQMLAARGPAHLTPCPRLGSCR